MHILDTIKAYKTEEIKRWKNRVGLNVLKDSIHYNRSCHSLKDHLLSGSGIIAEFKRKSPSKSNINIQADLKSIAVSYMKGSASAISILADEHFFGAQPDDILNVRALVELPLLRKEFVIDEYQIHQAKAMGADAILLISSLLDPYQIKDFHQIANELTMEVLFEIHESKEFDKSNGEIELIGINNRNLKSFKTDPFHCIDIKNDLSKDQLYVAESGISNPLIIRRLRKEGFIGFLIGEYLMQADSIETSLNELSNTKQV